MATLIIPSLYSFIWFGVFGAEGIRMQRLADGGNLCTQGDVSQCTAPSGGQISSKCAAYAASY
eukprot:CAMPEP_0170283024 /NCGR_PEP_ID=MMETSP0116_2-20130129/41539_1 /TAXON_ID=400756 /ORGANISM="Durinskia baltica, Strain CSIRO CS-38" /LENGTH=62 /DNA_ID=CAMNT_0010534381 /DNA_START=81 /DNA_END=266 /DNA_ORIENTATION=-